MTENLVSAISRFLTPELIGKMASVSGLDRSTTQSAVGAFVPAILNGLTDLAARPGGARQIADAIAEQPTGMLSNLAQTLGGASMPSEKGTGLLSSLFGGGVLNTLVSTLSRFVGIGEGSTRTLMGLLAPVVLGVLGREQRAAGLETGGLARMLMGQRDQISAAMPVGLSDLLSSRVRMHEGSESVREGRTYTEGRSYDAPETASTYRATTSGPSTTRRPIETREPESGWNWAYWALPLLALGGLLWYLLPGTHTPTDRTATAPPTQQLTPGTGTQTTTAPGKVSYLTRPEANWTPIAMFYQQDVHNKAGEKIGTVKDLLVGPDGRIHAAVLSVGRFLGLGDKDIAVPMSAIEIDKRADGGRVTIDVVKETLQTAPAFDPGSDRIRLKQ
jgi:sporulation protein YlmC with PRC-barrel domain